MATINQLRIERRAFFQEFKRGMHDLDSAVEATQRFTNRILARTRDVPEAGEYEKLFEAIVGMVALLQRIQLILESGAVIFGGL